MAREFAKDSPDQDTQVGALLISKSERVVAASFNGFVRGANDDKLPKTRPEKHKYIQHAERNLLYNCLDEGISTKGATVICTLSPCLECLRACYQSGINSIIFDEWHRNIKEDTYKNLLDLVVHIQTLDNGFTKLVFDKYRMKHGG